MKLGEVLLEVRQILIPGRGHPVEKTVAEELKASLCRGAEVGRAELSRVKSGEGIFRIAVVGKDRIKQLCKESGLPLPSPDKEWVFFHGDGKKCLWLLSSKPCFLYTAFAYLVENLAECETADFNSWVREMSFSREKSTFDLFLTQYARLIRNFHREKYIREYARLGFTHIEVNALAFPRPHEKGVPGEFYPDFYTYAPGLDQFVSSSLNKGVYPDEYLKANLNRLKENARLAVQYGLSPGLLCFEPRSVPDEFFQKYPTLRGARVDHPFRSFKPRYNLSVVHPAVQEHYSELISSLLREVPELAFLTIWTNDSGAGFEHTKSLYVGRNGGAYLIREWKDDDEIARAAASNIITFFRLLRDAASRINPEFRVITRLESFYGEHRHLWPELKDRVDVEVNSLLARGWESNYPHPHYPDVKVLGSAFHNALWESEKEPMEELGRRKSSCFFYHSFAAHTNHEPLLGIPFPWLTYEKLRSARELGAQNLSHVGGIQPPDSVPFAVNQEVFRLFQLDSSLDIDQAVRGIAARYAGEDYADNLVGGWRLVEKAVRCFLPLSIYSLYGTVWQRLLVRPLVPDIDRIPEEERAYYEKFMCTSVHNPNRVDLARDVLFELISVDYAEKAFTRIDKNVWEPLDTARELFGEKMDQAKAKENRKACRVFEDQHCRVRALRCLYETLRNTAVWVYAVHTFIETNDHRKQARCRKLLREMREREIRNSRELIELWEKAPVEWLIVSGSEETPFIHAANFAELLEKKIALMEKYGEQKPFIDPGYMFRLA